MARSLTGGKIVVNALTDLGVDIIFGIPGIHNLDIYDALITSKIKHITAKHEQGAGYMADGYARITGKPGVALVITGPGLTNIITAMGQAYHDSIPMVVISSQLPTRALDQRTGFLHELKNSTMLVKSVAKDSRTVMSVDEIDLYIKEAYKLANSGRPGPVHVEIPMDILASELSNYYKVNFNTESSYPLLGEDLVCKAAAEINNAELPLFIVGGGAWKAAQEIKKLAEILAAPIIQTCAGKGIVEENHPLCLGTRIHFSVVREFLLKTDLVIAVGTELSPTDLWERPLQIGGKLIQIDVDAANFQRSYPADIGLQGDAAQILAEIMARVVNKPGTDYIRKEILNIKEISTAQLASTTGVKEELDYIKEILKSLRKSLPENGILFADMTTPAYIGLSEYSCCQPKTFIHPVGFGTLGFALPAAIGAKVANPHRRIAVLAGDGGFQFSLPELAVACQENLCLPIIIWNDGGFGEIRRHEERRHPGKRIAVDHFNPNFLKLAEAYEIKGFNVASSQELEEALEDAFLHNKPTIIEVKG